MHVSAITVGATPADSRKEKAQSCRLTSPKRNILSMVIFFSEWSIFPLRLVTFPGLLEKTPRISFVIAPLELQKIILFEVVCMAVKIFTFTWRNQTNTHRTQGG